MVSYRERNVFVLVAYLVVVFDLYVSMQNVKELIHSIDWKEIKDLLERFFAFVSRPQKLFKTK